MNGATPGPNCVAAHGYNPSTEGGKGKRIQAQPGQPRERDCLKMKISQEGLGMYIAPWKGFGFYLQYWEKKKKQRTGWEGAIVTKVNKGKMVATLLVVTHG